ncbi:hypothetical protein ACULN0_10970 [Pectobacterium actinidiae]|uniref:hypothetical protein n=1 Tax=Pectobacterium actinidiae TaxID=1507808 RepID=UPI0040407E5A
MAGMTVRQLIKELKKMPPDSVLVWRDHDQDDDEINNFVRNVEFYPAETVPFDCIEDGRSVVSIEP